MIKEVIVVEGKDDMAAVKRACQAEIIITNGLGITAKKLAEIKAAQERCGVIVLTDPDYPGEKIRGIIDRAVPGCKHAYLPQNSQGSKPGRIGVEYCSPDEIREALQKARTSERQGPELYSYQDLLAHGLVGDRFASRRREKMSRLLNLGHTNAKSFLSRLNAYGISREEFNAALGQAKGEE